MVVLFFFFVFCVVSAELVRDDGFSCVYFDRAPVGLGVRVRVRVSSSMVLVIMIYFNI